MDKLRREVIEPAFCHFSRLLPSLENARASARTLHS
jgi:hypothetical protein